MYAPRAESELLPLHSSPDLSREELGELLYETVLQPGDVLYMPRGTVHEAQSLEDCHSLHITLSVNQRNSWADFLRVALPQAVELAAEEDWKLRSTLPFGWLHYMVRQCNTFVPVLSPLPHSPIVPNFPYLSQVVGSFLVWQLHRRTPL